MQTPDGFCLSTCTETVENHCLSIKLISCENYMREGRTDRLTEEDRRRFEELFLPYLDAAYNLARLRCVIEAPRVHYSPGRDCPTVRRLSTRSETSFAPQTALPKVVSNKTSGRQVQDIQTTTHPYRIAVRDPVSLAIFLRPWRREVCRPRRRGRWEEMD
jgi:hypothetical protein